MIPDSTPKCYFSLFAQQSSPDFLICLWKLVQPQEVATEQET